MKTLAAVAIAIAITVSSFGVASAEINLEQKPSMAGTFMDMALLRPIGLVTVFAGSALFIVTLPIAAFTDSIDSSKEALIDTPIDYTFKRKVGDLDG